jgi:uncharacterized protein (DUF2252 family)
MSDRQIWPRIEKFNQSRPAALRQQKYQAMATDPFSFFRGTCHLFHQDWPVGAAIDRTPQIWICGDLHLENFGTYKGIGSEDLHLPKRQVYFGINDFDEAALAPVTRDLARLAVSILLVGKHIGLPKDERSELATEMWDKYCNTVATGEVSTLSKADGIVGELLQTANDRQRPEFLRKYLADDHSLQNIEDKLLPVPEPRRSQVLAVYQEWAALQSRPAFYDCLDIKQRIAGLGSLGVDRYLLLIAGKSVEKRYLLDFKEQPTPALQLASQPGWPNNALRVLVAQSYMQPIVPDLRGELEIDQQSFSFRELQPSQDKIKCADLQEPELRQLVKTVGKVTAWSHLQGCGQQGAVPIGNFQQAINLKLWPIVLDYATGYAKQVRADWAEFAAKL